MAVDKITLQILSNHCTAAAQSMARTLMVSHTRKYGPSHFTRN